MSTVVALAVTAAVPAVGTSAQETPPPERGLVEVDRLPVPGPPGNETSRSGWLVLNPTTRRAYQIFESGNTTTVESFDLDTLVPRRRVVLTGVPIPTGRRDGHSGSSVTSKSAEVVHAVDEEAGILYLGLSDLALVGGVVAQNSAAPDARRPLSRYVAIDEHALDEGREAVAAFREPAVHAHLHSYWLHGMDIDHHRATGSPGRKLGQLVLLLTQPSIHLLPTGYSHELVRWDVGSDPAVLRPDAGDRTSNGSVNDPAPVATGERMLDVCRSAPLTGGIGNPSGSGSQWEMLVRQDDIWLVCHSAQDSAAVARLGLDDGAIPVAGAITLYLLSKGVYDVVADRGSGRLLLRTARDDGETWWVFDVDVRRFTGSLAAKLSLNGSMSTGLDPATGRMYMLLPDYVANFGGRDASVRGGFQFADTRLASPVPFENVRPDLSYPAHFRIRIDPVTGRVFVRRGRDFEGSCTKYPSTQAASTCPTEQFYRVFRDTVPIPEEQPEADDSRFTTDVPEADGVTQASYFGTGSGYGVRTILVGGLSAATDGHADRSPCGRDDRQVLAGSVGSVSVSDVTTAASASSLDADVGTRNASATPRASCAWPKDLSDRGAADPLPAEADSDEFSFDKRDNQDPAVEVPDGVNDYEASCTGDGTDRPPTVGGDVVPRDGFSSEVTCDRRGQRAEGKATGELSLPEGAAGVRAAKGHAEVRIVRKQDEGIRAVVDSWARGVVIPGLGEIGAVRGEALVEAAGRPGTATTRFERTICDIDFGEFQHLGCLDLEKDTVIDKLNEAATGRAEFRLRAPDPKLAAGSRSGYQAGIQRDRLERFEDRVLARDSSLAVPALEVVLHRGGGRQIVHLAGAEATVSYGIACLNGQGRDGKCADGFDEGDLSDELLPDDIGDSAAFDGDSGSSSNDVAFADDGTEALGPFAPSKGESAVTRFLRAPVRAVAAALRLLFNNPRELGLMTAVWLLLYGPFRLAGRHRSIRSLRRRRLAPT
jgi:hypothetical protein